MLPYFLKTQSMFKKIFSIVPILTVLCSGILSSANSQISFDSSKYYKYGDISLPSKIELPTVFELNKSIVTSNDQNGLLVVDQNNQPAEMFARLKDQPLELQDSQVKALSPTKQFDGFMSDLDSNTYTEFDLDKDGGKASFEIDFGKSKSLEGLLISLSSNVKNPDMIEILGQNQSKDFTIIAKSSYNSFLNYFPPVRASKIIVNLFHSQVLRINEIYPVFKGDKSAEQIQNQLFFLAIPGNIYS